MAKNIPGFAIAFLIVVILAFFVVRPLLIVVLAAVILAYVFYPLYKRINEKLMSDSLSALLVTLFIFLIILAPTLILANSLTKEFLQLVSSASQPECLKGLTCNIFNYLKGISPDLSGSIRTFVNSLVAATANYIASEASSIFLSLSTMFFHMTILFFIVYYFLKDGERIVKRAVELVPLREVHKRELAEKVDSVTHAMIFGNFVVAILQGLAAFLGFWLLGVPNPVLWALVTLFVSLIPVLGAFFVWFPAAVIIAVNGFILNEQSMVLKGIALFFYGAFVISMIDNLIKPKLVGERANVHPVLILIGAVGGISVFGIVGLIIGPLVLALLLVFLEMAEKEGFL